MTATQAKLRDAVIKSLGPQYQLLQNHMTAQLAHQFQVAQFSQLNSQLAVPTDLAAYAADARWEKEAAGITFNGMPVMTDDRSKMMIMGARVKATDDPDFTTQWKTESGFVTLDAAALIAVSDAVLAHVDHVLRRSRRRRSPASADGSITTTAQIDAIFADPRSRRVSDALSRDPWARSLSRSPRWTSISTGSRRSRATTALVLSRP